MRSRRQQMMALPMAASAWWMSSWIAQDQRDQLADVVAVAASGDCRERDAVRLDDQVVLAAGTAPVQQGRTGGRPTLHRADVAGVDRCAGEVQQV
ncbi:hypothetical protein ACIRPT_26940 [Streptomyces sp. NPDC101227]|uniref:hypothetical protein n=1 Tax=Streptomyces sp. NPDC101227 TaxID=3366136 RepID=UPI003818892C